MLVQVSGGAGVPVTRGGGSAAMVQQAQRTFEEAVGRIRPAVQGLFDQLVALPHRPSEVSVEFGINLHAEARAYIAQAGTSANFTVKLSWDGPDRD
ncbi:CU044_2847 family protein [Kocuria arenosa]|uniref:CU044_2847 family protein n=1 Tax=Kocuria arenosa TaxID=3071446 RepID=UPI0034D6F9B5